MKKIKSKPQDFQINMEQQNTNVTLDTMRPSDELQVYYNDAYMREKQRFNDMFGMLEDDSPAPDAAKRLFAESNQDNIDLSEYVTLKKFKRVRSTATIFVLVSLVLAAATAFFALKFLNIF